MLSVRGANEGQPAEDRAAAECAEASWIAAERAAATGGSGPAAAADGEDNEDDYEDYDPTDSVFSSSCSGSSLSDLEEQLEELEQLEAEEEEASPPPPPKRQYKKSRPVLRNCDGTTIKFSEAITYGFKYKVIHTDRLRTNACAVEDALQVRGFTLVWNIIRAGSSHIRAGSSFIFHSVSMLGLCSFMQPPPPEMTLWQAQVAVAHGHCRRCTAPAPLCSFRRTSSLWDRGCTATWPRAGSCSASSLSTWWA